MSIQSDVEPLINAVPLVQGRFPSLSSSSSSSSTHLRRLSRVCCFVVTCLISLSFYMSSMSNGVSRVYIGRLTSTEVQELSIVGYEDIVNDANFEFQMDSQDVLVFLHIQKTGGTTFGRHLVKDIDLEHPCKCRHVGRRRKQRRRRPKGRRRKHGRLKCDCFRPGSKKENWLFSRYSTGWKCGVHSDYTELTECVDQYLARTEDDNSLSKMPNNLEDPGKDKMNKDDNDDYGESDYDDEMGRRRYFYITFLRNPIDRYLSEYRHVRRGATWQGDTHTCRGQRPSLDQLKPCYNTEDWTNVTLEAFMHCSSNLAANRQTWMLADLRLVDCYNKSVPNRDRIMLESAMFNLEHRFAYFGLTEMQTESQLLFENTFGLRFLNNFTQVDLTTADKEEQKTDQATIEQVAKINHLDVKLYQFAKDLLKRRMSELLIA